MSPSHGARPCFRAVGLLEWLLSVFELEQVALTFNGGKDACVVFHLFR
jgi:predicted phosphoadenosine phosphosulfate sulfurtransferase